MADLPVLAARTLDACKLMDPAMSPRDVAAMTKLLRRLSHASVGKRLLEVALSTDVQLRFGSALSLWYPGRGVAAAQYRPRRRVIVIGRGYDAATQVAALAHEFQHFCDEALGWGEGWSIQSEIRAQQTEALVIRELRLDTRSYGLAGYGTSRSAAEIERRLRELRFYADLPNEPPRPDGRVHSLLTNFELASALASRHHPRVGAVPVLVASALASNEKLGDG